MTREQAINSMISHGFTVEQVGEIIKAVTTQLSSELEKNSKKLEKGTTKNDLGVDCISREQALRELKESAEHHANDSREEILLRRDRDIIRALPSVTSKSCDAISRQAVIDEMEKRHAEGDCITKGFIKNMPSVTPQEPRKGHWDKDGACPFCGYFQQWKDDAFCGHCGAQLGEVEE